MVIRAVQEQSSSPESLFASKYISLCLGFYGPVNSMGSCQAWSVYLTTLLLGRLSPLSDLQVLFVLRFYGPVNPMGHVERGQFT